MQRRIHNLLAALSGALLLPAAVSALVPASAQAQPDQAQLLERLVKDLQCRPGQSCDPVVRSRTRSITGGPAQPAANPSTEAGRRNLELAARTRSLPSSDVEVYFPYDSADLVPETRQTLDTLAKALKARELAASSFALIGHTDARGGETYNQSLSERRARAVRSYLAANGGVDEQRLSAWGRGKSELKMPSEPFSGTNRRVQLINTGAKETAAPPAQVSPEVTGSGPGTLFGAPTAQPAQPPAQRPAAKDDDCRVYSPVANATVVCPSN